MRPKTIVYRDNLRRKWRNNIILNIDRKPQNIYIAELVSVPFYLYLTFSYNLIAYKRTSYNTVTFF